LKTITTTFTSKYPLNTQAISGVEVTYYPQKETDTVDIHIWIRGAGAGSLWCSLEDSWNIITRILGKFSDYTVEQDEIYR